MKKCGRPIVCAFLLWSVSRVAGSGNDDRRLAQESANEALPQGGATVTPTPTPTPAGNPQIDAEATIDGPNGGHPQFFIVDVENEPVTNKFLEGEFGYSDHKAHVTFVTGKIQTVTINGNQGSFTGMATIGGKHRQMVQFVVNVTANQHPATGDTFSISLSNGYSASGNLTSGFISIQQIDPEN